MRPVRFSLPLAAAIVLFTPLALDAQTTMPASSATTDNGAPATALRQADALREAALRDDTAWQILESLTTEVGPRVAGSEADARAVAWMIATFKTLGFDKVWTEPVTFPKWVRRGESAAVIGASAQRLHVTTLGGSAGGTVTGEIVRFASLAELEAAPAGSLADKIAFLDYRMERMKDGSGYGPGSRGRSRGPSAAIRAGAIGYLMRSVGTDDHRNPHTGMTRYDEGLTPVPAAALSNPDADQLTRLLKHGPVMVRLALDCGWDGEYTSQNVIAEIRGSGKPDEVVAIGGHLDSWDLGTGAIDDGAGIAITTAAALLIKRQPTRPQRTIRVIAYANEEQGLHGGRAYALAHKGDIARQQIMAESDFGAGRIYAITFSEGGRGSEAARQIETALAPLGIAPATDGGPGPDVIASAQNGVAWAELQQDGTDYFDLHHSPDDTLDKVDPEALRQNVAAYAVFAWLAANAKGGFGSAPKTPATP
ncbi:MAG: M28 family peptidase [Xanthomonadaceae bacterium]|nr:M28 family peptidase [Xanthomonadaceae bacterium]